MCNTDAEKLIELVRSECPALCRMERQLTIEQAQLLLAKFDRFSIENQLRRMDNWKGIEKKNLSVYLTCVKWFEEDIRKGRVISLNPIRDHPFPSKGGELREIPLNPPLGKGKIVFPNQKSNVLTCDEVERRKQEFLIKHPVGSEFKFNGIQYTVRNSRLVEAVESGEMVIIEEIVSNNSIFLYLEGILK